MARVKSITTQLPTYLELLMQENFSIRLIFQEGTKSLESPETINLLHVSDELSVLELTGTPLETDLGADDTVCADAILNKRPPSWSVQEARQYPLTLKDARTVINDQLKCRKTNECIYCICHGIDHEYTVGLGVMVTPRKISRLLVSVLPCCREDDEITRPERMIAEHLKSVRTNIDTQVRISTRKHYDLFGYDLKNCAALQDSEHNGHISVEVSTNDQTSISQSNTTNIQVVVGHRASPLSSFWEDLCIIQTYLKLMENLNAVNGATVVNSQDDIDYNEIRSLISDIFITVAVKKVSPQVPDLANLRQMNIVDSLWIILKQCNTLLDLRDSFHFFFEEMAEQQMRILIPGDNNTAVAEIIRGIGNGRVAVPALSFFQSLELLVELGLEKLKNDYLVILTSFSTIAKEEFVKKWSELCSESPVLNASAASQRRTRVTINRTTVITDQTSSKSKLTFLDSMHKVAEFMYLYQDRVPMERHVFDSFCEALSDQFIVKFPKIVQSCDLKQMRLCRFRFDVSSAEAAELIKNKSPTAFSSTLFSAKGSSEVWTVLQFSENPIFPPCVFQDYDIPDVPIETKVLYVTKLVKYVANL